MQNYSSHNILYLDLDLRGSFSNILHQAGFVKLFAPSNWRGLRPPPRCPSFWCASTRPSSWQFRATDRYVWPMFGGGLIFGTCSPPSPSASYPWWSRAQDPLSCREKKSNICINSQNNHNQEEYIHHWVKKNPFLQNSTWSQINNCLVNRSGLLLAPPPPPSPWLEKYTVVSAGIASKRFLAALIAKLRSLRRTKPTRYWDSVLTITGKPLWSVSARICSTSPRLIESSELTN